MIKHMTALTFLFLSAPAFASTIQENFSTAGSNCGGAWFNGCVDGWTGFGAADSLARTHITGDSSRKGVLIRGGTSQAPNGIQRTYALPSGSTDHYEQIVPVQSIGGTGTLHVEIKFRDSQGTLLMTGGGLATVTSNDAMHFQSYQWVPAAAATVDVSIHVVGVDAVVFVESWLFDAGVGDSGQGDPASAQHCQDEGQVLQGAMKMQCEGLGGTYNGICTGWPAPTESGCKFACTPGCEMPLEGVVHPSGF